ncbi:MAG: hypothetical protein KatS3mg050_4947 [Litorilinea sp.]|nr:MAG: hypothetical protein KatS3mg050_4947 [Litorilinea sp.]
MTAKARPLPFMGWLHHPFHLILGAALVAGLAITGRLLSDGATSAPNRTETIAIRSESVRTIEALQSRLARTPEDARAYAQLGIAYLRLIRDTADTSLYSRAQEAFDTALKLDPQNSDALAGRGALALSLHDFSGALEWADRLLAVNPYRAEAYGIRADAQIELGEYEAAAVSLQQMVDLRPGLESYSRISYLRELHGDGPGAIEAMRMAVENAAPGTEPWLWTLTHLGHLYRTQNRLDEAIQIYDQVLAVRSDYAFAVAGLARIRAAQGKTAAAIALLAPTAERLPLPEFLILLGELYQVSGEATRAQEQYELVRVIQQLNAAAGMAVDLELATFEVLYGDDPEAALDAAQKAYRERPTLSAADTLAWALYRNGYYREAQLYSQKALRLGTRDTLLYLHAGLIAQALGEMTAAREYLDTAHAINPYPSPLAAQQLATARGEWVQRR